MSGFALVFLQLNYEVAGDFTNRAVSVLGLGVEGFLHFKNGQTVVDYRVYVVAEGVVVAVA